jgi:DNA invertase Pin-like site-specific DNA recombinase
MSTTASRCLDLIHRHAPRLMLQGGGRIESERKTNKLNKKTIDKIVALRKTGMTLEAIAESIGFSKSAVQVHCKQYILADNASHKQPSVS